MNDNTKMDWMAVGIGILSGMAERRRGRLLAKFAKKKSQGAQAKTTRSGPLWAIRLLGGLAVAIAAAVVLFMIAGPSDFFWVKDTSALALNSQSPLRAQGSAWVIVDRSLLVEENGLEKVSDCLDAANCRVASIGAVSQWGENARWALGLDSGAAKALPIEDQQAWRWGGRAMSSWARALIAIASAALAGFFVWMVDDVLRRHPGGAIERAAAWFAVGESLALGVLAPLTLIVLGCSTQLIMVACETGPRQILPIDPKEAQMAVNDPKRFNANAIAWYATAETHPKFYEGREYVLAACRAKGACGYAAQMDQKKALTGLDSKRIPIERFGNGMSVKDVGALALGIFLAGWFLSCVSFVPFIHLMDLYTAKLNIRPTAQQEWSARLRRWMSDGFQKNERRILLSEIKGDTREAAESEMPETQKKEGRVLPRRV